MDFVPCSGLENGFGEPGTLPGILLSGWVLLPEECGPFYFRTRAVRMWQSSLLVINIAKVKNRVVTEFRVISTQHDII